MTETTIRRAPNGQLALVLCGRRLELEVLRTRAGYYIGTTHQRLPFSRESEEYFETKEQAETALATGQWTQRKWP